MRESIFANREPIVRYWYSGILDFFKDFSGKFREVVIKRDLG